LFAPMQRKVALFQQTNNRYTYAYVFFWTNCCAFVAHFKRFWPL